MKMLVLSIHLALLLVRSDPVEGQQHPFLNCASCANVKCPPEPTNCVLDRIPCGCCNVCALNVNDVCHGFSSGCGPGMVCVTAAGVYDERPPWYSPVKGVCVVGLDPNPQTPPLLFHHSTPPAVGK